MKKRLLFSLLLALTLALSVTPAFAQGSGNSTEPCFGGGDRMYVAGKTYDDIALFGCNGIVQSGATISGGAAVMGGNLTVEKDAMVSKDVAVFGGEVHIQGTVGGDVAVFGGQVYLEPGAVVNGGLHLLGGNYSQDPSASVHGGITRGSIPAISVPFANSTRVPVSQSAFNDSARRGFGLFNGVVSALALAVLGVILMVFFPEHTRRVSRTAQAEPARSFGAGCLTVIALPVLLILLAITLIGFLLWPVVLVLFAAAGCFGWIAIGYFAGDRILEAFKVRNYTPVMAVFAGVLVLALLSGVDCLGPIIWLLVGTLGLGAAVLTRFGTRPYPFTPAIVPVAPYPVTPAAPPPAGTPPIYPAPPPQTPPGAPGSTPGGTPPEER